MAGNEASLDRLPKKVQIVQTGSELNTTSDVLYSGPACSLSDREFAEALVNLSMKFFDPSAETLTVRRLDADRAVISFSSDSVETVVHTQNEAKLTKETAEDFCESTADGRTTFVITTPGMTKKCRSYMNEHEHVTWYWRAELS